MHGHKIYIINIRSVNKYAHWGKDREFLGVLFTDTENEKNLRYNWHLNLIAWLILSAIVMCTAGLLLWIINYYSN